MNGSPHTPAAAHASPSHESMGHLALLRAVFVSAATGERAAHAALLAAWAGAVGSHSDELKRALVAQDAKETSSATCAC